MKIFERDLKKQLLNAAKHFSALIVTGPRRAGKTFLLQQTFPNASYHLLEDPDVLSRVKSDPRGWMESVKLPAIIDEIQNAPELFPYIRSFIDQIPRRKGQWLITGSQDFSLMQGVTESMTGRAAVFQLLPLSCREIGSWKLTRGGFPEVLLRPKSAPLWFSSYVQTYLERDVRSIKAVQDLATFRKFLSLLASRNGQILNKSDLAAPLGVSVPTISGWIGVLETTGHIIQVPPYFENFGKRLTKSPKLYWVDSGLVCHLLGLESEQQLERSPFLGSVFEGFIASEILKNQINRGRPRELYFFRDEQGLEIDFICPGLGSKIILLEVKWSKTVYPEFAKPMNRLRNAIRDRTVESIIIYRASKTGSRFTAVAPGVTALTVEEFLGTFPEKMGQGKLEKS